MGLVTLYGLDASQYNDPVTIDISDTFYLRKCTEGLHTIDHGYVEARHQAITRGMVWGAYHFGHPEEFDAIGEAAFFVQNAAPSVGDILALDLEPVITSAGSSWASLTASQITTYKNDFLQAVKKLIPRVRVGLYCDQDTWHLLTDKACGDFLWLAAPSGVTVPADPLIVQVGTYQGVDSDIIRSFNTITELEEWAAMPSMRQTLAIGSIVPGKSAVPLPPPNGGKELWGDVFLSLFADWAPATVRVAVRVGTQWLIEEKCMVPVGQRVLVLNGALPAGTLGVSFLLDPAYVAAGGAVGYLLEA